MEVSSIPRLPTTRTVVHNPRTGDQQGSPLLPPRDILSTLSTLDRQCCRADDSGHVLMAGQRADGARTERDMTPEMIAIIGVGVTMLGVWLGGIRPQLRDLSETWPIYASAWLGSRACSRDSPDGSIKTCCRYLDRDCF